MRAVMAVALFSMFSVGLAGCLNDESAATDSSVNTGSAVSVSESRLADPGTDFSEVVVEDHGVPQAHAIRALHEGSQLLELAGYNPLSDKLPPEGQGAGWAALGAWGDYLCVTQFVGGASVAIVDISDPYDPQVVSQVTDALTNGDCQFTADGKYLFAGAYLGGADSIEVPVPYLDRGTPGGFGLNVWDVSDKSDPKHVLFSNTGEYHTHHLWTDDEGTVWVVQAFSGNIYKFHADTGELEHITQQQPMVHDMWIDKHPITGQTLLFSGAGKGFVIYDFDDPETNVTTLALWEPPEHIERAEGWHRHELSTELIDGKAVLFVSGEDCGAGTKPYIAIDVTEVLSPKTLGSWELPGTPISPDPANLCTFSSHEFSIHDGYVASANYHGGVWLTDFGSGERLLEPVTLGYYLPDKEPIMEGGTQVSAWPWSPFVWGAQWDDRGYIWFADASSGLYSVKVPGVSDEL